jgi:hypothetical protein
MSERLFRAVRDFVLVRLPHYLRVFAITLIFASPVLAALYFAPTLDHFSKAMYHIPSFALWALSAIIFYRLRKYLDYDRISRDASGELHWQEELSVRDFVFVRLPHYLRVFAITLIFASPVVLVTLYFAPLDHFNKAMYHIPSFALLALSATIFYRLRWYVYFDQDPWRADPDLLELPRHLRILFGIAIVLLFIGGIFLPRPL